jgi:hypothetical protein
VEFSGELFRTKENILIFPLAIGITRIFLIDTHRLFHLPKNYEIFLPWPCFAEKEEK